MRLSRRGWNNVMIIGALLFMAIVQLPELIKERNRQASVETPAGLERLLPELLEIEKVVYPQRVIERLETGQWEVDSPLPYSADVLVDRWQNLLGTRIDDDTRQLLRPQLVNPLTVEVWFEGIEEPVRLTIYEMPQFWLMQNWQAQWIAVSVEKSYLFP